MAHRRCAAGARTFGCGGAGAWAVAVDLRDVARRSGVSVSTASRALRGSGRVSPATPARVPAVVRPPPYPPHSRAPVPPTASPAVVRLRAPHIGHTTFVHDTHVPVHA